MAVNDRHPAPEDLAEYVDGVVSAAERDAMEGHLADCDECRAQVTRLMAFAAAELQAGGESARVSRFHERGWVRGAAAALAAAAVLVLAIRVARPEWLRFGPRSDRPELQELVAALANEPTRPVEGRLTGGFTYAPPPIPTRGGRDRESSPDTRIATAKIERAEGERSSAENRAALATASVVLGRYDRAIELFETALTARPDNARWLSDLSAAYLASFKSSGRTDNVPKALDAAGRAFRLDPSLREARFNRALALEASGLTDAAVQAWRDFLAAESDEQWRAEARRHLAALTGQPVTQDLWRESREWLLKVEAPLDAARLAPLARLHKKGIRECVLDDLIPAWGRAVLDGDSGRAQLLWRRATELATALSESGGDRTALLTVSQASSPTTEPSRVARAFVDYGEARRLDIAGRRQASRAGYARSQSTLRLLENPLWAWSAMFVATGDADNHELDAAMEETTEALRLAERLNLGALIGEIEWVRGGALVRGARYGEALKAYDHALRSYEAAGEIENVAGIHTEMAYTHRMLANPRIEWQHRLESLNNLERTGDPLRQYLILFAAGTSAMERGLTVAAHQFEDAAVSAATASHDGAATVEALSLRARTYYLMGDLAKARADLAEAKRRVPTVDDPIFREASEARMWINAAEISMADDLKAADEYFAEALHYFNERHREDYLPLLYLARGRSYERRGMVAEARAAFDRGIEVFEWRRQHLTREAGTDRFFERAWSLFEEQMRLSVRGPGSHADGLQYAERLRGAGRVVTVSTVTDALPDHVVVLYYVVLPDRAFAWRIERDGLTFIDLGTGAEIERRVGDLVRLLAQRASDADRAAAALYDVAVRPVLAGVASGSTLVIVPDGGLHTAPFAILPDRLTSHRLVENHPIDIAPSLGAFLDASNSLTRRGLSADPSLFVASNPAFDRTMFPDLDRLPASEVEATTIAARYRRSRVLVGGDATKAPFIRAFADSEVVHFAGHAIANAANADASMLIFAPDAGGDSGALFARDLRALRVSNTRLLVLAGCETAKGAITRSDGVLSLARPFLTAGVPSVLATLWPIADNASAVLLDNFHRRYLETHDAVGALRSAQLDSMRSSNPSLAVPASWGAFQVIGGLSNSGLVPSNVSRLE